jgi:hypothetical protein
MSEELKDASITLPKAMLYALNCSKRLQRFLTDINQMGNICQWNHGHHNDHHILVRLASDAVAGSRPNIVC